MVLNFNSSQKKNLIRLFMAIPMISATVSAIHMVEFLSLGNHIAMAIGIAAAYELANMTTLLMFVVLPTANRPYLIASFVLLILMQIIGNIYYSFDYIYDQIEITDSWVSHFMMMIKVFPMMVTDDVLVFILAVLIGVPIPATSLLLIASMSDQFKDENATISPTTERKEGRGVTIVD